MKSALSISLRHATPGDLELLRYWDSQPHIVAAAPNDDWPWEEELPRRPHWRELLIAELDGTPLGFIQIIDPALEETHYWGDAPPNLRAIDIWIGEADNLGKGYGTIMMQLALERCFQPANVTAVIIDPLASNTKARRFYERLGFKFIEYRDFDGDHCAVYELARSDWEKR